MNSASFSGLQSHFMTKVSDVQKMVEFQVAVKEDDECLENLEDLQSEIDNIQIATASLRRELQMQKYALKKSQETNSKMTRLIAHLNHALTYTPERLPKLQQDSTENGSGDKNQSNQKTAKVPPASQNAPTDTAPPTTSAAQPISGKQTNTYYPEIEYLKVDEFIEVPKYLKGRITYDQVNKFIDGMNKAYLSKYKLLKQKKSSLNDLNRKRYENYKAQETKDTAGSYFITDDDLKDYGGLKIDKVGRSIQTILRHCKRVREKRGGKITRIVYVDNY